MCAPRTPSKKHGWGEVRRESTLVLGHGQRNIEGKPPCIKVVGSSSYQRGHGAKG